MDSRYHSLLKLVCAVLVLVVLYQMAGVVRARNPLENIDTRAGAVMRAATTAQSAKGPTNAARAAGTTNPPRGAIVSGTNQTNSGNVVAASNKMNSGAAQVMMMRAPTRAGSPAGLAAKKDADLPPPIQARIDRITQSEILGPVIRPLPMALLGIAGNNVFFRAPNGQTGLLTEGEELGGVKLLRIGTNRVLIEQDGEKQELTVFAGLGGESLAPAGKEKPQ